ncbi:BsuPI-related putative proteinase inhibitor [Ferdinandcohnia quinoae]|uniref:Intracellular proteinase inhibitor BsuPI domain-containing protein n=1 Tax=Fredinandcohnia quinoae TaxID=2918902 RepID=A0AAW5E2R2_9BACI|nr:BsuPI-related putative proteinase inhibitor [Fredinandcohnia sp. SECRCQ15]MCH1625844.1 BsuPI-related putative proteinase inhibitor [Fredinandcohnia sp. SECRCQ15]
MKQKLFLLLLSIMTIFIFSGCGAKEVKPVNSGEDITKEQPIDDKEPGLVENPIEKLETNVEIEPNESEANIIITLKNTSENSVNIIFPSGQKFDFVITNEAGHEVYSYSIDKSFVQVLEEIELKAGTEESWVEKWDYTTNDGERLPAGEYKISAKVTASQVNEQKVASNDLQSSNATFTIPVGNNAFRNVEVSGENGEYIVTGEARVFEASFLYTVEDGHDYIINETAQMASEGAPAWAEFKIEISIPKEKLPENGALIIHLYEKSAKDGSIINSYNALLQRFQ